MSISDDSGTSACQDEELSTRCRRLHRLATVRRLEGVSRRGLAQRMKVSVTQIRRQEEAIDLPLSVLYDWHKALGVPVAELIVESKYSVSHPLMQRAQLVRLMKTAQSLLERADGKTARMLAQMLVDELVGIMPELRGVMGWNTSGPWRATAEIGVAALRLPRVC